MTNIPKIIHQIWPGKYQKLPEIFKVLSETRKEHYLDWNYILWDDKSMKEFILNYYPQYWDIYIKYPYDIQRWDNIRYLFG